MASILKSIADKTAGLSFGDGLNTNEPEEEFPSGPPKLQHTANGDLPAPLSIKPRPDNVEVHSSKLADFYMEGRSPRSANGSSPLLTPTSASRRRVAFAEPPSPVPIATVEKADGNPDRNFWRKKSLRRLFSESKNVQLHPSSDDVRIQIVEESMTVLRHNDLGGYTVPAHGLYPFQWNWDSAIVASGWAVFDEARAWQEIESLFSGQWEDGMVPSIVFHKPSTTYFPGPEIWGTKEKPSKSTGITQPPVAAMSVRFLYEHADDPLLAMSEAGKLFPKLLAWHRWFYKARDPFNTGVVAILHPWESGMDNSPAWDEPMRFPVDNLQPYVRCDLNHVHPEMRPTKETYDHYLTLLYRFKNANFYDPDKLYHISPFRVTDLCVNCILFRANRDLRWLAIKLGRQEVVAEIDAWLDKGFQGFESLWDEEAGIYKCRDQITGKLCPAAISAGFLPLFAGVVSEKRAARLVRTLEQWLEQVKYGVPSMDPADPRFEPLRYWRGPVWIIINWMISNGLKHYGYDALANRIKDHSIALTSESGLFEYFNPVTGEGEGGHDFSWTAAMSLAWMDRPAAIAVGSKMHGPKKELGASWTATPVKK